MNCKTKICMKDCTVNTMNIGSTANPNMGFRFNIGYFVPGQFLPELLLPLPESSNPRFIQATPNIAFLGRWFSPGFTPGSFIWDILESNPSNPMPDPSDRRSFFWSLGTNDQLVLSPRFEDADPFLFPTNATNDGQQFILPALNQNREMRYLRVLPNRRVIGVADQSMGTPLQLFNLTTVPIVN